MSAFRALGPVVEASVEVVWVDEDLHRRAWTRVASGTRKGPSLVDWVGLLVMKEEGIRTALALDRHVAAQGFSTLP